MKIKSLLVIISLLLLSAAGFSQEKQFAYYFDKDLNPAPKANATFSGRGMYQSNGLFELRLYNLSNQKLLLIENYTDSSLQLNEGSSESFYPNGTVESTSNYASNKPDGLWLKWDSTGRVIDSTIYEKGRKMTETSLGYHKNGVMDSLVNIDFTSDSYHRKFYDDSARLAADIAFSGQRGLVKYYKGGNLTSTDTVFSRLEIEAEFPGGNSAWNKYIVTRLQNNADKILKSGEFGTCIVKFIVGKDGKIKEAEATTMKGTALAEVAVSIIKNGPKWHPASQYGRAVNAYRLQPVTLNQTQ